VPFQAVQIVVLFVATRGATLAHEQASGIFGYSYLALRKVEDWRWVAVPLMIRSLVRSGEGVFTEGTLGEIIGEYNNGDHRYLLT
jgi:hypothetical protein